MIVDELSEEINLLIKAINDGKNEIVHPQLLTLEILMVELEEFKEKFNVNHLIPISKQINSVFLVIIPDYECLLLAQGHTTYIPTDKTSFDECRFYRQTKMCKRMN